MVRTKYDEPLDIFELELTLATILTRIAQIGKRLEHIEQLLEVRTKLQDEILVD